MMSSRWVTFPLAIACLGLLTPLQAEGPDRSKAQDDTPAQRLRKELDQAISIEIIEQPLSQALERIRMQTKVQVTLDRFALMQMGMDGSELVVNLKITKGKLRTALRSLGSQAGLSLVIVGEQVMLTTEEVGITRQLRQPVNVSLNKVPCADALKKLAQDTATNIVIDPKISKEAQAPISLEVEEVPLEASVRLLANLAGLKPVRLGNVLFITSPETAKRLREEGELTPGAGGGGSVIVPGGPGGGVVMPLGPAVPPVAVVPGNIGGGDAPAQPEKPPR